MSHGTAPVWRPVRPRPANGGLMNPGHSSESFNTSYNMQRVRQAAILSSEVLNLPDHLASGAGTLLGKFINELSRHRVGTSQEVLSLTDLTELESLVRLLSY
jgi:hypothetical protein